MYQLKNNLSGKIAMFKKMKDCYDRSSEVMSTLGIGMPNYEVFKARLDVGGRLKFGLGRLSIVITKAILRFEDGTLKPRKGQKKAPKGASKPKMSGGKTQRKILGVRKK